MRRLAAQLLLCFVCILPTVAVENYPYRSDYLWQTVPDHADWLYKTGERARVDVGFFLYGMPQDVEVSYEIGPDMMPATSHGKVRLRGGRATIDMGTLQKPGFLDLRLTATVPAAGSQAARTFQHHVKVGFSPEQLKPYTQNPSDFDAFWQQNVAEARKAVPNSGLLVSKKYVEAYSTDKVDCYLLKLHIDRRHSIYGYLTMPKSQAGAQQQRYPVVLCPPGAGIKTIKEPMRNHYYAENGFIRLEMEIHGLNPEMTAAQFAEISAAFSGENGYVENGLDNRDNYYMKHVYVACVRAIDFLTSLPEWDGRNVAVQGGSQGGALSIVTAALDSRVTHCVANHPALSDVAGYLDHRAGGWPHMNRDNQMLTPEKVKTLQYYDVVNFARRLRCPAFLTWGYNDNVCPPTTSYIVWNLIPSEKESLVTPVNEHWTTPDTNYRQMRWIKERLR
ncbi:MAG: acetylxylan esterase [Prevotella sp.]|nr:acetylxylan esterase [Prevotella sp.]